MELIALDERTSWGQPDRVKQVAIPPSGDLPSLEVQPGPWIGANKAVLGSLAAVVIDNGGASIDLEAGGHVYLWAVYSTIRNQWVGLVNREAYVETVTHLDNE
jgi:hypothetical protein